VRSEEEEVSQRIACGSSAVEAEIEFFQSQFGAVASEWKKDASRVTEADHRISERILAAIENEFPEDDGCSEELNIQTGKPLQAKFAWVLDPIDGTNNFAIGLPNCAISLALLKDGHPLYGWVYDYAGKQLVHGGAGRGLFKGKDLIQARTPDLQECTPFGLQFPLPAEVLRKLEPLLVEERVRSLGSSTMEGVYITLGQLQGAVDFRVKVWDIAAFFAFFDEIGMRYRFLDESPFPLRVFDPSMKPVPYLAGSDEFCDRVEQLLGLS